MKAVLGFLLLATLIGCSTSSDYAKSDTDTVNLFKGIDKSAKLLRDCYGYAVFPNIGKAGILIGGARGEGHVYDHGRVIGKTVMNQVSVGFQLGAQDYSELILFQNKSDLDHFTSGNFEFDADASVTAITASASVSAGTNGAEGSASGGIHDATGGGGYYKGMAVFTLTKGGLMYEAALAGQKFSYTPINE